MGRLVSGWRRWVPFAPSAVMGLLGTAWIAWRPMSFGELFGADRGIGFVLLGCAAVLVGLLGAAWLLERLVPSFRHAGRLMEQLLRRLRLPIIAIVAIAAVTSASEELLFRGALLEEFGIWPQAFLFGLLHPATRAGWSYPVFAFVSGLALGWLALATGTLWAPLAVHFAINLQGLWSVRQRRPRRRVRSANARRGNPAGEADRSR